MFNAIRKYGYYARRRAATAALHTWPAIKAVTALLASTMFVLIDTVPYPTSALGADHIGSGPVSVTDQDGASAAPLMAIDLATATTLPPGPHQATAVHFACQA